MQSLDLDGVNKRAIGSKFIWRNNYIEVLIWSGHETPPQNWVPIPSVKGDEFPNLESCKIFSKKIVEEKVPTIGHFLLDREPSITGILQTQCS